MKNLYAALMGLFFSLCIVACAHADVAMIAMGSLPDELYPVFGKGQNASEAIARNRALENCQNNGGVNCTIVAQTTEYGEPITAMGGIMGNGLHAFLGWDFEEAALQCQYNGARCYNNSNDAWEWIMANPDSPAIMDGDEDIYMPPTYEQPLSGMSGDTLFAAGLGSFTSTTPVVGVGHTQDEANAACKAKTPGGTQPCKPLGSDVSQNGCLTVGIYKMPDGIFEPKAKTDVPAGATLARQISACLTS